MDVRRGRSAWRTGNDSTTIACAASKTWTTPLKEDLVRLIRHAVVGIRRWNKKWASLAMDLAQDRRAWPAAVRDAVNAMDADSARAG